MYVYIMYILFVLNQLFYKIFSLTLLKLNSVILILMSVIRSLSTSTLFINNTTYHIISMIFINV